MHFLECLEHYDAVLTLLDQKQPKGGGILDLSNYGSDSWGWASIALSSLGYPDQAMVRAAEGVGRARTLAQPLILAEAVFWASACHVHRGDWKIAASFAEECAEESSAAGYRCS